MNDIEDLLRDAFTEHIDGVTLSPAVPRRALLRARRTHRTHVAVGAGTALAAVSVAAVVVTAHDSPSERTQLQIGGTPSSSAISPPATAAATQPVPILRKGADGNPGPSQELQGISLPDPAPGFPVRRGDDQIAYAGFGPGFEYWDATFLVAKTPGHTVGSVTTPTGQEATVQVVEGSLPSAPDANNEIDGSPVVASPAVGGHTAYVTQSDDETNLVFADGDLTVEVTGFGGAPVDELVTLAEAIRGLS